MEIIRLINEKFNNKYDFLRVLSVCYNTLLSFVEIEFLYPENVNNFDGKNQQEITEFIKQTLGLDIQIKIIYKKSYLDDNLIKKHLINYLKKAYSSMMSMFLDDDIMIEKENNLINVKIKLISNIYNYFVVNNANNQILNELNANFIANFNIILLQKSQQINSDKLIEREEEFLDNLPKPKAVERYLVYEPVCYIGRDITPMPEPIKNQKEKRDSVILAGTISELDKKTYISKRTKAKGLSDPSYYFKFILTDFTGNISAIFFSNKTTYKKAINLKDGDTILIIGNVKNDYNKMSVSIKDISFCQIIEPKIIEPDDSKDKKIQSTQSMKIIDDFKVVRPTAFLVKSQENLFDVVPRYDDEVYQNEYVVFDCETTGLDCNIDEIIEIGAVKIKDGLIKEQFQTFIHPTMSIPQEITRLTTITDEMVKDAPILSDAIVDFYKFCKGCILVGYNVDFDIGFIKNQGEKAGVIFDNEHIDVMAMAKKKLFLKKFKLSNVVESLHITLDNAHRAIYDATATAYAFLKLSEKS